MQSSPTGCTRRGYLLGHLSGVRFTGPLTVSLIGPGAPTAGIPSGLGSDMAQARGDDKHAQHPENLARPEDQHPKDEQMKAKIINARSHPD